MQTCSQAPPKCFWHNKKLRRSLGVRLIQYTELWYNCFECYLSSLSLSLSLSLSSQHHSGLSFTSICESQYSELGVNLKNISVGIRKLTCSYAFPVASPLLIC